MTVVAAAPALWRSEKTVVLSGHTQHDQNPSPVAPGFDAPDVAWQFRFRPHALAAAMARTITLRHAPDVMLQRMARAQLSDVEYLIEDGRDFRLSPQLSALADAERAAFAGRVGAGMTDLVMNTMGYAWRDNGACLATLDPHADFLYAGGAVEGHGVVLAEAQGSFAQSVSKNRIAYEARTKYARQVRPHIAVASPHGKIVHGYAIAFGSRPSTADTFLHVAETRIDAGSGNAQPPGGSQASFASGVPTSLALMAHRSNFLLMGASQVVAWIDWVRGAGSRPASDLVTPFFTVEALGRRYLVAAEYFYPFLHPWAFSADLEWSPVPMLDHLRHRVEGIWQHVFAMDEWAAKSFLNALTGMIALGAEQRAPQLQLPVLELEGLGEGRDDLDEERYPVARFRDGLALLGRVPRYRLADRRSWSPERGFD